MRRRRKRYGSSLLLLLAGLLYLIQSGTITDLVDRLKDSTQPYTEAISESVSPVSLLGIPDYYGDPSVLVNGGQPFFTREELRYADDTLVLSGLDRLGRCGTAYAVFSYSEMPDYERDSDLSVFTPSGWKQAFYKQLEEEHLYDRSHLLGWQFWGRDSDDERNLITGTVYLNRLTMVGYENDIASYLRRNPNDSVLYRVTPDFHGDELVARGVLLEAQSLYSDGYRLCVYCYNVQPGIEIDYTTGDSHSAVN